MSEIPETIQGISSSASQSAYGFSQDMMNISNQISKINKTIQNASEYVGVSLVDASDEDTKQDLSNKIENCKNSGKISAEMNAGGIAGAIAKETDMDASIDKIAMVSFVESNDWKVLIAAAVLLFLPAYLIKARHK